MNLTGTQTSTGFQTLERTYYQNDDVVSIARELIGKVIVTNFNGQRTEGVITETEAYAGITDKASHAFGGKRTVRTEPMFAQGGIAYVYLCYGMHTMFNVVTNCANVPHAVLIRAIVPKCGKEIMSVRRNGKASFDGPGKVCQALGIQLAHTSTDLTSGPIRIQDQGILYANTDIEVGPRIGIDYAGADALLPYRFKIAPSRFILSNTTE